MKIQTIFAILILLSYSVHAQETEEIVYEEPTLDPLPTPPPEVIQEPEPVPIQEPKATRQPFKLDMKTLKLYQNEVLVVSLIFFYLLMYVRGKGANVRLMERFYRKVSGCLEANFSHVGFTKTSGQAPFNGQSPSESTYYASGRINVEGIEMKFNTKKRQDLIYMLLDIFMPDRDTVTIDIPVKAKVPLVLAVAQKRYIKDLTDKNPDIKTVTKQFNVANLPQNYQILGEAADTVDKVIDNYVVRKLNELNNLIISIHYTDLKIFSESSGHLRMVLNLAHKQEDHFLPALQLALHLADKAAELKISAASKDKAIKSREVYNQSKEKQELQKHNEELKKKKEEKLRQEEARLRSLPPEKQKREQQKRKKKEFNKLMKGKTMKL